MDSEPKSHPTIAIFEEERTLTTGRDVNKWFKEIILPVLLHMCAKLSEQPLTKGMCFWCELNYLDLELLDQAVYIKNQKTRIRILPYFHFFTKTEKKFNFRWILNLDVLTGSDRILKTDPNPTIFWKPDPTIFKTESDNILKTGPDNILKTGSGYIFNTGSDQSIRIQPDLQPKKHRKMLGKDKD